MMRGFFDRIADAGVQKLLRRERELLVSVRETLESEQVEEQRRLDELLELLDDLFRIVVVGEFNSGKSSLINALFGQSLRVEGPIPVDDRISILRYGDTAALTHITDFIVEQTYPVEFLRTITLIDTPGTNSIVKRHQEITHDFIPRADLVLFVTSIDRPLSESEREFLTYIREWGKKIVFVVSKIDTKSEDELRQVLDYLNKNIRSIFGFDPVIFPIAAKTAFRAKAAESKGADWQESRFEALENYIFNVLSQRERIRLKLAAPLETLHAIMKRQFEMIESRQVILSADMAQIRSISEQLDLARRDLGSNFQQFVVRVDNLLMDLERRGLEFLDRTIRINQIMLLRNAARFREEFQRQVFEDWEGSIDRTIQESVDWLVKENMKLWRGTVEEFHRASEKHDTRQLIGKAGREFAYNREEVYLRIRGEAERRIGTYNVDVESRKTIDAATRAVIQSFGLGAGALGLGWLVTTAFSSVAIDVTGLTAATMLLVTSFLILPYKRSKAKTEFSVRINQLRQQLREALERESIVEIDRMMSHITGAFEPYRRFHEIETAKIEQFSKKLHAADEQRKVISGEVEALTSEAT